MTAPAAYGLLFLSALLSATLLPGSSEAVLLGFLAAGQGMPEALIVFATLGNVAGSTVNWSLGRFFAHCKDRAWFPVPEAASAHTQAWFARWGQCSLLLSWLPVIGDPLTLAAGVLQVPLGRFLMLVIIGKLLRYTLLAFAWNHWGGLK